MPRGSIQTLLKPDPGGVREDVSPALLPEGSYLASSNWLTRRGRGRPRPGYDLLTTATDTQRVLGLGFRGSRQLGNNIAVFTKSHQYHFDGNTLSDISLGSYTSSSDNELVRSLTFTQGGTDYLLAINRSNALMEWTGTGLFTATSGSPPAGKDLFVLGNRLVVIQPNSNMYRVQWSRFKDRTSWTSTDISDLRDTPGYPVAGAPFGPNTGAIYKDDCVYLATVQAAVEPFQFQFIGLVPGPMSAAALVNALGIHYWIGEDFSIYKFDGAEPKLVSSGLTQTIATNLNYSDRDQSFGYASISQDFREVWFFYPNRSGTFNGISLNIITEAINHHTFTADTITAASDWRMGGATIDGLDAFSSTIDGLDSVYSTIDGMDGNNPVEPTILIGTSAGEVHILNGTYVDDDGTSFSWSFEDRWVAPGATQSRVQVDAVDTLWRQCSGNITVTTDVAVTDKLTGTETGTTATFNAGEDAQHLLTFPNLRGKLVRVKYSGTAVSQNLEYRGGILTSWPRGRV